MKQWIPMVAFPAWAACGLLAVHASVWPLFDRSTRALAVRSVALLGVGSAVLGALVCGWWVYRGRRHVAMLPRRERWLVAGLAVLLAGWISFGGLLPRRALRVPVRLVLSNVPSETGSRQTFYLTGLVDERGQRLVSASTLHEQASEKTGCRLVNNGNGIWSDLPAMGRDFRLEWEGHLIVRPGLLVRLEYGSGVRGSVLQAVVNGRQSEIDIGAMQGQAPFQTTVYHRIGVIYYHVLRVALLATAALPILLILLGFRSRHPRPRRDSRSAESRDAGADPNQKCTPGDPGLLPSDAVGRPTPWWAIGGVVVGAVFLFNLHVPWADLLWYDDGFWYFIGHEPDRYRLLSPWRGNVSPLTLWRDLAYSWSMVTLGMPTTRLVYIALAAISSWLAYAVYRRVLGLDSRIAVTAAILPNILPGVYGIPVGINSTYALFSLIPALASMLFFERAHAHAMARSRRAWLDCAFGLLLFAVTVESGATGMFLVPSVLFVVAGTFLAGRRTAVIDGILALAYTFWFLTRRARVPTVSNPTSIPFEETLRRIGVFFSTGSFIGYGRTWSQTAALLVAVLGFVALIVCRKMLFSSTAGVFRNRSRWAFIFATGWIAVWAVCQSVIYVAGWERFRPYDYTYLFNFSTMLLSAIAAAGLSALAVGLIRGDRGLWRWTTGVLATACVLTAGVQRIQVGQREYAPYERNFKLLRSELAGRDWPSNSQFIVVGMTAPPLYMGVLQPNSGYLRYVLGRGDVTGVVGPDRPLTDVFRKVELWSQHAMSGLRHDRPMFAFRRKGRLLEPVEYVLRVYEEQPREQAYMWTLGQYRDIDSTPEARDGTSPRTLWTLYRLSLDDGMMQPVTNGVGIDAYHDFIRTHPSRPSNPGAVLFAPRGQ